MHGELRRAQTQRVKLGEIDTQIRHLEQVLHFFTVRIVNYNTRWQHSENHLK